MVALVAAVLREEARRREASRADAAIPMRPDHGQDILDDIGRGGQPGYPAIGRLKGLAELRRFEAALNYENSGMSPQLTDLSDLVPKSRRSAMQAVYTDDALAAESRSPASGPRSLPRNSGRVAAILEGLRLGGTEHCGERVVSGGWRRNGNWGRTSY